MPPRSRRLGLGVALSVTVAALGVPLAAGGAAAAPTAPTAARLPAATSCPDNGVHGPDISSYQHPDGVPIDWNAVKAAGTSLAILNVREPAAEFAADVDQAGQAGLIVGLYYYAYPTATNATQEADAFVAAYGTPTTPTLPPALDLENAGGLSVSQLQNWTATFLTELQARTGRTPMIYTYPYFWQTSMGGTTAFAQYPLWEANYTCGASPSPIGGWGGNWTLWQYTDDRAIPGISGSVDDSRFNGTALQLASFAAGTAPATGSNVVATPPVDPNVAWVDKVVPDAAHVQPSVAGAAAVAARLAAGTLSRPAYAQTIVDSPTGYNDLLNQDFEAILHRAMSPASTVYWNALRKQGLTDAQVRADLATSAEFIRTAGADNTPGTNAAWLSQLYLRLLNRPGTAPGIQGWLTLMAHGQSRLSVAAAFLRTSQGEATQVYAAYQRVLHRAADAGGSAASVALMAKGTTFDTIEADLYGSNEYYAAAVAAAATPAPGSTPSPAPTTTPAPSPSTS